MNGQMHRFIFLLVLCLSCLPAPLLASRVALVIGNDDYNRFGDLRNAGNDARAIARLLKNDLDFELIGDAPQMNVSSRQARQLIKQFGERLRSGDVAFFYFAGHGIGAGPTNFLIPVDDTEITYFEDVPDFAVDAQSVLRRMEQRGEGVNIMILDACRDQGLPQRTRSGEMRGLSRMNPPAGSFIGYAASPGQKAADGSNGNGVFTEQFVRLLATPGYTLDDVFSELTGAVKKATSGKQTPIRESNIEGRFVLVPLPKTATTKQFGSESTPAPQSALITPASILPDYLFRIDTNTIKPHPVADEAVGVIVLDTTTKQQIPDAAYTYEKADEIIAEIKKTKDKALKHELRIKARFIVKDELNFHTLDSQNNGKFIKGFLVKLNHRVTHKFLSYDPKSDSLTILTTITEKQGQVTAQFEVTYILGKLYRVIERSANTIEITADSRSARIQGKLILSCEFEICSDSGYWKRGYGGFDQGQGKLYSMNLFADENVEKIAKFMKALDYIVNKINQA